MIVVESYGFVFAGVCDVAEFAWFALKDVVVEGNVFALAEAVSVGDQLLAVGSDGVENEYGYDSSGFTVDAVGDYEVVGSVVAGEGEVCGDDFVVPDFRAVVVGSGDELYVIFIEYVVKFDGVDFGRVGAIVLFDFFNEKRRRKG